MHERREHPWLRELTAARPSWDTSGERESPQFVEKHQSSCWLPIAPGLDPPAELEDPPVEVNETDVLVTAGAADGALVDRRLRVCPPQALDSGDRELGTEFGLRRSARVVTSAGLVMIAVVSGFDVRDDPIP